MKKKAKLGVLYFIFESIDNMGQIVPTYAYTSVAWGEEGSD